MKSRMAAWLTEARRSGRGGRPRHGRSPTTVQSGSLLLSPANDCMYASPVTRLPIATTAAVRTKTRLSQKQNSGL